MGACLCCRVRPCISWTVKNNAKAGRCFGAKFKACIESRENDIAFIILPQFFGSTLVIGDEDTA
ncbi:MAG: hypothetical protein ACLR56_15320 [Oscillospiraceae bacterium]